MPAAFRRRRRVYGFHRKLLRLIAARDGQAHCFTHFFDGGFDDRLRPEARFEAERHTACRSNAEAHSAADAASDSHTDTAANPNARADTAANAVRADEVFANGHDF